MSDRARRDDGKTVADYEAFVAARPEDERWELVGGVIEMMTNPTGNHGQITMNIAMPLKATMDAAGCRTYAGSMRVQTAERRAADAATIPDIVVHCGPDRNRTFIFDPLIIVEVLSRSTMDYDRGPKLAVYKSLESLRHIVLIYQDQMRVEHYYRADDGWFLQSLTRTSQTLTFDGLDFSIGLETIYFDVPVLRTVEPTEPSETEPAGPVR